MERQERQVFLNTAESFLSYKDLALRDVVEFRRDKIRRLSPQQQEIFRPMLEPFLDHIEAAIEKNGELTQVIGQIGKYWVQDIPGEDDITPAPSQMDEDKVQSTLRQIAREWSQFGSRERDESYGVICSELASLFPDVEARNNIKVISPGSGLGRLPYEIANMGFNSVGNEFSTHMLFTSLLIINTINVPESYTIYPFVHNFSGNRNQKTQLVPVRIPDIAPSAQNGISNGGDFSMAIGEFDESFQDQLADVIVTMFFLDTSPNILDTIETISSLIPKGGTWINFGPLLWHYESVKVSDEDDRTGGLDLDLDSILSLVERFGWSIGKRKTYQTTYCSNPEKMSRYVYDCEFFVATKIA